MNIKMPPGGREEAAFYLAIEDLSAPSLLGIIQSGKWERWELSKPELHAARKAFAARLKSDGEFTAWGIRYYSTDGETFRASVA